MHLASLIRHEHVLCGARDDTREMAVRSLVRRVAETVRSLDARSVEDHVSERERLSTTTYPSGVAMPHARLEGLNDFIIAVHIPTTPIPSEHGDIRLMFLILADISRSSLYLNVIAALMRICRIEENVGMLAEARSADEFVRTLASFGEVVSKTVRARDIMSGLTGLFTPRSTVKEALDHMTRERTGYIPVCDSDRRLVGEVDVRDILAVGMPHYTRMLGSLGFTSTLEPLEELLRTEASITLEAVMRQPPVVLSPESTVLDIVSHFMRNEGRTHFPVVENEICTGVLNTIDIVTNFLRI